MNKNMIEKETILSSISKEFNIVWARWIFLILLTPIYVWLCDRNVGISFGIVIIFAIIYNFINHITLINKKYHKNWFDNNIYFDIIFISLLIAFDGGYLSSIYICYYVFSVYECIKREYNHPVILGIGIVLIYSSILLFLPFDYKNISSIILRDIFILICSIFILDVQNQISFHDRQHKKEYNFARKDKVSGLLNKNAFEDELNEQLDAYTKNDNSICLILLNIDNLKLFNDTFGYPTGDDLIKYFSKIILETINLNGKAFRYSEDDFLILLSYTDLKESYKVAEIIRRKFSSSGIYIKTDEGRQKVTVSCGISCCPEHSTSSFEIIEYAKKALKEAKIEGKNKVVIAEKED